MARSSPNKRAKREQDREALLIQLVNTLHGVDDLVRQTSRRVLARDCAGARTHHDQVAVALKGTQKLLAKASRIDDELSSSLRRTMQAQTAPATSPAPRASRPNPKREARSMKGRRRPVESAAAPTPAPPTRPAPPEPIPPIPAPPPLPRITPIAAPQRPTAPAPSRPCPPDREECGYAVDGATCTITAALTVPARGGATGVDRIPARYCIVEIRDLHTSHLALRGFAPDPEFPAGAQERDYRLPVESAKVDAIAAHYDPALIFNTSPGAVDGVPVATEDRIVLGGNGRTMATALVYAGRGGVPRNLPKQYLGEHAHEFGLDPSVVEGFDAPMLVRTIRVANNPRALADWSRRLNTSLSQQLDPTRLAVSRARFVSEAALRQLDGLGEEETLAEFFASARSRDFVRALQRDDVIDARAAAVYLSGGLLNDKGRALVEDLLVAVLLPDAEMIEAYGRGPVASLARAAAPLVQVTSSPEYDLRPALAKAVRDRVSMRRQSFKQVDMYLRQGGMFVGTGAAVAGDQRATMMLRILDALEASPAELAKFARRYRDLALPGASGQSALFAAEHVTPVEALKRAAGDVGVKLP